MEWRFANPPGLVSGSDGEPVRQPAGDAALPEGLPADAGGADRLLARLQHLGDPRPVQGASPCFLIEAVGLINNEGDDEVGGGGGRVNARGAIDPGGGSLPDPELLKSITHRAVR